MNEEKLVKLLKEHFPTKREFLGVTKNLEDLNGSVVSLKQRLQSIVFDLHEFKKETKEGFSNIDQNLKIINEKLDDLKSSSNTLDKILEQYPIERIKRLEKHNHLATFVPTFQED